MSDSAIQYMLENKEDPEILRLVTKLTKIIDEYEYKTRLTKSNMKELKEYVYDRLTANELRHPLVILVMDTVISNLELLAICNCAEKMYDITLTTPNMDRVAAVYVKYSFFFGKKWRKLNRIIVSFIPAMLVYPVVQALYPAVPVTADIIVSLLSVAGGLILLVDLIMFYQMNLKILRLDDEKNTN